MSPLRRTIHFLQEFSIPLISGVTLALIWANVHAESYQYFFEHALLPFTFLGHKINFHFLINDIFMVFFFGIAAVEITQAMIPGGSLNPISKAINPLFGTAGGVIGPIFVFFFLCYTLPMKDLMEHATFPEIVNGWGIPTATDIALAWLVASMVFGKHPAVSYLLLLAVADDAIGLVIIAIFYPDPSHPVEPAYLILNMFAIGSAFLFRKYQIKSFIPYIALSGTLSWLGLIMAHLHPALALVFVVPFMPESQRLYGDIFEDEPQHSTLIDFEHAFQKFVDFGLFAFGLANAGVPLSEVNSLTWVILLSLIFGKVLGITFFGILGDKMGFPLPRGMNYISLSIAGLIAGLGLTVALFISTEAYQHPFLKDGAKMGSLFSIVVVPIAFLLGRFFKVKS